MKKQLSIIIMAGFFLTMHVSNARADVAPPNTFGCKDAAENDACVTDNNKKGVCTTEMCSGLDYSNVDDAGVPASRQYECLVCTPQSSDDGCTAVPRRPSESALLQLLLLLWK
jgi:hypothetical protein